MLRACPKEFEGINTAKQSGQAVPGTARDLRRCELDPSLHSGHRQAGGLPRPFGPRNDRYRKLAQNPNLKKQSQFAGLRPEIRNKTSGCQMKTHKALLKKYNLKKQTQFIKGQNNAKPYLKGYYGIIPACGARKKQSQSKPIV